MATSCPVGFDAAALRAQVLATYDRVAREIRATRRVYPHTLAAKWGQAARGLFA